MNEKLYLKQWKVDSASGGEPHKVLLVKKDRSLSCDCMGWRYRRTCRHVEIVRAGKAGKSSPVSQPKPAPVADKRIIRKQHVIVQKFSKPSKRSK